MIEINCAEKDKKDYTFPAFVGFSLAIDRKA